MTPSGSLDQRMKGLGILESDLEEIFARSGGPGGQNVNKVSTAVTLRHLPSGLSVTVQDSRSQALNRKLARERLCDVNHDTCPFPYLCTDLGRPLGATPNRRISPRALEPLSRGRSSAPSFAQSLTTRWNHYDSLSLNQ